MGNLACRTFWKSDPSIPSVRSRLSVRDGHARSPHGRRGSCGTIGCVRPIHAEQPRGAGQARRRGKRTLYKRLPRTDSPSFCRASVIAGRRFNASLRNYAFKYVTFLTASTSYDQPATFTLIGATDERLPQNWESLAVAVHLLLLNQKRCELLLKTSVAAHDSQINSQKERPR